MPGFQVSEIRNASHGSWYLADVGPRLFRGTGIGCHEFLCSIGESQSIVEDALTGTAAIGTAGAGRDVYACGGAACMMDCTQQSFTFL